MPLIEIRGLSFGYETPDVIHDIDFRVDVGEVFCILGPNGCGKTTLLDCVLGSLRPRQGDVVLGGKSVREISIADIAKQIAYVPQIHEKTFPYKVMDMVLMGRAAYTGLFSSPSEEDARIAAQALEHLGIEGLKDRPYTQLSGGEGQLVMIARALAQQTPLIIMDEPTSHLDYRHELVILETVVKLVREDSISIIMATHIPNHGFYFENSGIPTRVAMLNQAALYKIGTPSEVLNEENLKSLYQIDARVVSHRLDDGSELKQIIPLSSTI